MVRGRGGGRACRTVRMVARVSAGCVVLAAGFSAGAQENTSTVAEALFRSGRSLMAAGDLPAACAKFAESHRIDPKLGTLMNLALCHEKSGRSASAWAEYLQAGSLAERAGQSDRARVARQHAAVLEPKLSHVIIDVDAKSDAVVVLDDQPIGPAAYRTAIPVDPGDHVLRATAPGRAPLERPFHVAQGAPDATLKVPALDALPAPASATAASPETAAAPVDHEARPPAPEASRIPRASSGLRTLGFAVGGAGIVLAGVGAYFGVRAFSDKSDAENACGATFCTPAGSSATNAMKTDETISTITMLAGVAAVGAGVYLVLSNAGERAPAAGAARVSLGLVGSAVRAQVSW